MVQYYIIDKASDEIVEIVEFESEEQADLYEKNNPDIYLDECLDEIDFDDDFYDDEEEEEYLSDECK